MNQKTRDKSSGWIVVVVAVIVALALIGFFSDGFGLIGGSEMAPGTTTPPNNPS